MLSLRETGTVSAQICNRKITMEQFLKQLQTLPEAAELIRRVEEGGCPAAVTGLQSMQRACIGAAIAQAAASGRHRPWPEICAPPQAGSPCCC